MKQMPPQPAAPNASTELPRQQAKAAWAAEARDRLLAYKQGHIRAVPLEVVRARYRAN